MRDGVVTWGDRAGLVAVGVSIAACGGHVTAVLRRPKGPPRVYDRSLAVSGPPGARTPSVLAKDDSAEGSLRSFLFGLGSPGGCLVSPAGHPATNPRLPSC